MTTLPPDPPFSSQATPDAATPPPDVASIRIFVLVALIVNSIATLWWIFATIAGGAATCGVGCLLIVIPAVSGTALVLDAIALSKLNQPASQSVATSVRNAAIMDIAAGVVGLTVVPLIMGILTLVYLQKPHVMTYYGRS